MELHAEEWVAIATFALALATVGLGIEAKRARDAAKAADISRQRDTHIMAIRPLLISEPDLKNLPNGMPCAKVRARTGEYPVLNLNVTIRGAGQDGMATATSTDRGSIPPSIDDIATVELTPMLDLSTRTTWGAGLEVVISYHGLLGQWVVERYEWNFNGRAPHANVWRLYRLEIAPLGVVGAASLDQRFGGPPLFE